ncbi:MAG: glycosyltransferase family 4 protein [Proteobacteria bacterium]|nr:glycosyltransferase family 4 protein [Pseudomonadota bacterium]
MSSAQPIPVLFTHYGEQWIRGSEQLLLDLMGAFDPADVRPIVWTNGTEMAAAARAAGFPTYHTDFAYYLDAGSPRLNPLRYAGFIREGLGLVRRHGVRAIHANSAAPVQWMLPVARLSGRRLLVHLHSSYLRRSRVVLGLRHVDLAVGVSNSVLAGLRADGMAERKLRVIYNGIDIARLQRGGDDGAALRARLHLAADGVLVAAIGSLIARKGHDVLLRALALLPAGAARLCIAGDGPERAALERLAAELGVAAQVDFLGYCADPGPVYRAADIVALASRGEALPLVLLEAGCLARPVVATDVGGVGEAVADGITGLLAPSDDPPALAAALARLVADPEARRRMGAAGQARVAGGFSLAQMTAGFLDVYRGLAAPS